MKLKAISSTKKEYRDQLWQAEQHFEWRGGDNVAVPNSILNQAVASACNQSSDEWWW
jgi:hypothetical protein